MVENRWKGVEKWIIKRVKNGWKGFETVEKGLKSGWKDDEMGLK